MRYSTSVDKYIGKNEVYIEISFGPMSADVLANGPLLSRDDI